MPYAEAAQEGHAATFVVGAELQSLEQTPEWSGLISALQSVYKGQLIYDENYTEFAVGDQNLPLPGNNVDAYPRFDLPDGASESTLTQAWESWLGTHPALVLQQMVLAEVGIVAVPGAYQSPGAWIGTVNSPIDVQVQANWYQAVCNAVQAESVGGGIYWWEVNFDADPADPAPFESDRLTFLGRPAAQVIQSCFSTLSGTSS
ncbi:MAG: glycoside hydrolase family 113, partial [Streptosporangiaceae bacterium]